MQRYVENSVKFLIAQLAILDVWGTSLLALCSALFIILCHYQGCQLFYPRLFLIINYSIFLPQRKSIGAKIKLGPCVQFPPPPRYTLLRIPPPTRKHILFLNKNISLVREYYMNVYTYRIASTTVWTLQVKKKCQNFLILLSKIAEIHVLNKLKSYKKAPIWRKFCPL